MPREDSIGHGLPRPAQRSITVWMFVLLIVASGAVWDSVAVKKVREGIRHFVAGDYAASTESFEAADAAQPDNAKIGFDRACSLAAQGSTDTAKELFQQAALSRDLTLSADAHYNLGNLEASSAKELLGEEPVSLEPEQRPEAIDGLMSAVRHYRDCLRVKPAHAEARHNLELVRLFIKHIQAEWERRDRERARDELSLLEFLARIETQQQQLRSLSRELAEEEESPLQRQATREAAEAQRTLQEEIEPLKQKVVDEIQGAGGQAAPADAEHIERIVELLHQLADAAGGLMLQAADELQTAGLSEAADRQRDVLDQLNQIYMVLAPFDQVLQRAISVQQPLIDASQELEQRKASAQDPATVSTAWDDVSAEQTWKQSRISDWARLLLLKAEAELPEVQSQLEALPDELPESAADTDPATAAAGNPAEQLQALQESMQKATELAPQVEELSGSAENHLRTAEFVQATPDQQEALRLLKEIAEPLRDQQDQNQQDQNQQQQDQDEQQQNQNEQSQDQQDQDGQPEQQQDSQDPQKDQAADQQQQSARERAESVLRRAREREREHRDLQKELRRILGGVIPVDRDW